MSAGGGRKRQLSAEEQRLWEEVRRSVRPLSDVPRVSQSSSAVEDIEPDDAPVKHRPKPPAHRPLPSWSPPIATHSSKRVAPIDEKTAKKLKKGRLAIDARIDLHGMIETKAHGALRRFLEQAWRDDLRIVLVITGKGERSGGVLRRAVPRWLAEPPFSQWVAASRQALAGGAKRRRCKVS